MFFFPRVLLSLALLSFGGCSLFFTLVAGRAECDEVENPDACDGDTSVLCRGGQLLRIQCGANRCDALSGECNIFCGDGFVQPDNGEECDDANDPDCNRACRVVPVCGNGQIEAGESCDGNTAPEGCDADCQLLPLFEVEPNDDTTRSLGGGTNGNDFSSSNANGPFTADGVIAGRFGDLTVSSSNGDGDEDVFAIQNTSAVSTSVQVDLLADCSSTVALHLRDEAGLALASQSKPKGSVVCASLSRTLSPGETIYAHLVNEEPEIIVVQDYRLVLDFDAKLLPACGDGVIDFFDESCDPPGEFCSDACSLLSICGDNFIDTLSGEQCDDGNRQDDDGCSNDCKDPRFIDEVEPNDTLVEAQPVAIGDTIISFADGSPDIFTIENASAASLKARVDTFESVLAFGQPCTQVSTHLEILDAQGALVDTNTTRQRGSLDPQELSSIGFPQDLCAGLTIDIPAGQSIFVVVNAPPNTAASYVLRVAGLACGDGVVSPGEECEPGAGCSAICQRIPVCGDGIFDFPEEHCEDGNTLGGDACPSDCILVAGAIPEEEGNDESSIAQGPFTQDALVLVEIEDFPFDAFNNRTRDLFRLENPTASRQDVLLRIFSPLAGPNQPCPPQFSRFATRDDQNNLVDIAINSALDNCPELGVSLAPGQHLFVETFPNSLVLPTNPALHVLSIDFSECGNGEVEFGEECEPPGSATCDVACQRVPLCGDGLIEFPESCEDGNLVDEDGCSSACLIEDIGLDCPAGQTLLQAVSTDVPVAIPDNNAAGVLSALSVSDTRIIQRVIVSVESLTHTFDGDLRISLVSPNNVEVLLFDKRGNTGDNLINTLFDDGCIAASGTISGGTAPFTGCFAPEGTLSVLNNQSANGQWRLKIVDTANIDTGTLNAWTLGLCVQ